MKQIFLILSLLLGSVAFANGEVGNPAPDFSLKGADGKTYKLSDFKDKKIVVLEWFNEGCPYVRKHYESGNMQRLQTKYKGDDLVWFTIASSAKGKQGYVDDKTAAKVRTDHKMDNTALLIDKDSVVAKSFGAKTTPHMFVINKAGLIAYNGAIDSNTSARAIKVSDYEKDSSTKKFVEDAIADLRGKRDVKVSSMDPYGCSIKY